MSTRFFENQEAARRQTSRLVFLFGCAVVGIVALLYGLAVVLTGLPETDAHGRVVATHLAYWQPELFVQVVLATLAVVAGGSLFKILQLRGGGAVVAESLGGQLLATDTSDPEARRILNVVEEMAIASGTPTPPVYLLPEDGINAFAAGFTPSDAVIGITRGSIQRLSRDELQGVIAHEFSHILSGDMRLNIKLMGAIHGILLIGIIGYYLLRSSMFAGGRRNSRDNSGAVILLAGFGLMIVGFLGTFFGNLIKASVSRQREFLADASAVQFTRNPGGIAGALKKIAGFEEGGLLTNAHVPEASHLFFSQALRGGLQSIFATHPPLAERIKRIDPSFDADALSTSGNAGLQAAGSSSFAGPSAAASNPSALPATPDGSAIDQLGEPTAAHLEYAHRLIASLPEQVVSACHEPHGARAVLYALLINRDASARRAQLDQIDRFAEAGIGAETRALLQKIEPLDSKVRLPLVDLALPSLRRLSQSQYTTFQNNVRVLIEADQQINVFEWTLQRILFAHLRPHFERTASKVRRRVPLSKLSSECSVILSVLARFGSAGDAAADRAFDLGAAELRGMSIVLLPEGHSNLAALDAALSKVAQIDLDAAEPLLRACAAAIASDGIVSEAQGEMLRAIADTLGAPMPPLLPGQHLL